MKTFNLLPLALVLALAGVAHGQQQQREQMQTRDPSTHAAAEEKVYGWELMSDQERQQYQTRMRSLKTEQEREALRAEHHSLMQERAKAMGKTLPDAPPPRAGQGQGKGGGMGPSPR
jgi:uncharacterized protein HemX